MSLTEKLFFEAGNWAALGYEITEIVNFLAGDSSDGMFYTSIGLLFDAGTILHGYVVEDEDLGPLSRLKFTNNPYKFIERKTTQFTDYLEAKLN